ncbi:hypothetical protein TNCV_288901 [Trichonephila clavipes]|nr:hypothetical protein TNCV_288901 [Trichonephila clavipes]
MFQLSAQESISLEELEERALKRVLIRYFNMDYCAEVSYIRCNNGCRLPMEIAFARVDNPHKVFILHMRMPHDVYFTVKDLVYNKSQCERRNKIFNVNARRILKMDMESWWHTLQHFIQDQMGWDAQLAVRSKNQKQFLRQWVDSKMFAL